MTIRDCINSWIDMGVLTFLEILLKILGLLLLIYIIKCFACYIVDWIQVYSKSIKLLIIILFVLVSIMCSHMYIKYILF